MNTAEGDQPTEPTPAVEPEPSAEASPEPIHVPPAPEPAAEEAQEPIPAGAPEPEPVQDLEPTPAEVAEPGPAEAPTPSVEPEPAPSPAPVPTPAAASRPRPMPGPPRATAPATPAAAPAATSAAPVTAGASDFGRVTDDGSVYVRTSDGERLVGQVPDVSREEALAFFTRKFDELAFEVELLERRVQGGALSPEDAAASVKQVQGSLVDAKAVGDLASLSSRLVSLSGTIAQQRELRKAERAKKIEEAKVHKERIAAEAEKLSASNDWRNGANRLRDLLDEWKALPRLDKALDDALWRRFSTARTTYTRRRKAHFAELNEKRDSAKVVKERLVKEAEALADSTDWGPTSSTYRQLMQQWKAAGPAPKGVDDQLWKRFRGAQDTFFGARDAASSALDAEFEQNAAKKESLLVEAEALLPVSDLAAAKTAFRDIAERWDAAGKVPRERMKELEGRIRKVEQAIRGVEDDAWRRSNPEALARATDTVAQLEASIADLRAKHDKATAAGNAKKAEEHAAALEARESWLTEARKALAEFSG